MEKAGIVETDLPTQFLSPSGPTAFTTPAASYPIPAGSFGCSRYWPRTNINSARFKPTACTCNRTSPLPGCLEVSSSIFKTSGPPSSSKRTIFGICVSPLVIRSPISHGRFGPEQTAGAPSSYGPSSRKSVHKDAKLSVLDVCRLSHSRFQLDHVAIHGDPAVSVMVDGFRVPLRRIDPGLEHFKDEEIVLVDETGIGHLAFEIGETLGH